MSEEYNNQQESEVGSEEQQQQQQQEAVNTQDNAGIPPNAISTNKKNAFTGNNIRTTNNNNVSLQTTENVTPSQAMKDAQAQATVNQNLEGDRLAHEYNDNLKILKRIVGSASPVVEDRQETETQTDADGNEVQVPVTKKVTTGYQYYAVNGQPFEEWVNQTFGGKISIDKQNNRIVYSGDSSMPFEGEREDQQEAKSG